MNVAAPIRLTLLLLMIVGCSRRPADWTIRHAEYLERDRLATEVFSGADVEAAEKALLDWKQFVEAYEAPDVDNHPTLGIIAYRLSQIRKHKGDKVGASRYLHESMTHIRHFRDANGMTNEVTHQQFLSSMQREVQTLWQDEHQSRTNRVPE